MSATASDDAARLGPWYYPARYLHRAVTPLKPIVPTYPPANVDSRGRVVIRLFVDETGQVNRYDVLEATPPAAFEDSVVRAFVDDARYAPGLIAGYAVRGILIAEVNFDPGAPPSANLSIMDVGHPLQLPMRALGREN